ncbi:MAG: hypothetical protein ACR2P5_07410 [Gammaproteobacteria bacterium]
MPLSFTLFLIFFNSARRFVIPAQAGIQKVNCGGLIKLQGKARILDSRFRGNDGGGRWFLRLAVCSLPLNFTFPSFLRRQESLLPFDWVEIPAFAGMTVRAGMTGKDRNGRQGQDDGNGEEWRAGCGWRLMPKGGGGRKNCLQNGV